MAIENLIEARPRDLGGLHVGRVLPAVHRRSVGPFVFLDHMGPEEDASIAVRPHPHLHLATVTYLFDGAIRHRDSLGSNEVIQPGAINWMNAGKGIVHSERSDERIKTHGLQLWVALPKSDEDSRPAFDHYPAQILPAFRDGGTNVRVLAGTAHGLTSPVKTKSPLFYLDVVLEPGARVQLPDYAERAAYVIEGEAHVAGSADRVMPRQMAVFSKGDATELVAEGPTRLVLLGGEPLDGPRYIWWNFVSSDADRIIEAHHRWRDGKFPKVPGDEVEFIPAPEEEPHFVYQYKRPDDQQLTKLLTEARTIAMVGASNNPDKPSHRIMKQLLDHGYRVIPVNPKETEVLGQRAVSSLDELKDKLDELGVERIDIVDVFRKSEDTPPIADDAAKLGTKALWLQLGVTNDEAAYRAHQHGMTVVMDTCIGATLKRLGLPKLGG